MDSVKHVDPAEVTFAPVRAQGPGGQNVNKVANAVHLRFDIRASSLGDDVKQRLLALRNGRISRMKTPKEVSFVDGIPRNASGKVLKTALRGQR